MTTALEIIGGIAIILAAAARVPPAISVVIRACIPVVTALRDLHHAIRHPEIKADDAHDLEQPDEQERSD